MVVKVGIVGSGWAASMHARCLLENVNVELVALADVSKSEGMAFAKRYGIPKFYEDTGKLFEDPDVEAVYIMSPPKFHASQAIAALQHGKHVFSEKPPAISLKEMEKLAEVVEKTGLIYQIGFNRRFWPVYKKLKSLVETGKLKSYVVDIKMVRGEMERPPWTKLSEVSGGFLYDSMIHILDLSKWILGKPETIRCVARKNVYPHFDGFVALIEFLNEEKTIESITSVGHASWVYPFERVEVYGDHSSAITEENFKLTFSHGKGDIPNVEVYQFTKLPEHVAWGFKEEDDLFIEAVAKGLKPAVTVIDAYDSVKLVESCYQSLEHSGRVVTFA
ncbi:Gfo/Idh/MocA family oxidoreductase [Candidatus Bathyarchaeota archaeon]|nr:Gfo/Idh/MocA family oxidoreductase [Candidatus Bathyarchaeota archaeon]MBS7618592.1 Gfo/Idh/MocA family oxidoreductase [Candidatus Bathyarchaeota archaeon]